MDLCVLARLTVLNFFGAGDRRKIEFDSAGGGVLGPFSCVVISDWCKSGHGFHTIFAVDFRLDRYSS